MFQIDLQLVQTIMGVLGQSYGFKYMTLDEMNNLRSQLQRLKPIEVTQLPEPVTPKPEVKKSK